MSDDSKWRATFTDQCKADASRVDAVAKMAAEPCGRRASAEGEARGLERAAAWLDSERFRRTGWTTPSRESEAIRALSATPAAPARSYEDGVRDGLEMVALTFDASAERLRKRAQEYPTFEHAYHSLMGEAGVESAVAKRIRAMKAVPRG